MKCFETGIEDLFYFEPTLYEDERGFFYESYNRKVFSSLIKRDIELVQDNHSSSKYGVLRGIHLQKRPCAQAKLVRVISGKVFDVAVDLRKNSKTYLEYFSIELSAENKRLLWIPEGFGHAFVSLSENSQLHYKTSQYYSKEDERTIMWDDPKIKITWPIKISESLISEKDKKGQYL